MHPKSLTGSEKVAPRHELFLHHRPVNLGIIESLREISLGPFGHRDYYTGIVRSYPLGRVYFLLQELLQAGLQDVLLVQSGCQHYILLGVLCNHLLVDSHLPLDSVVKAAWRFFVVRPFTIPFY
jgi:hypothetical protein